MTEEEKMKKEFLEGIEAHFNENYDVQVKEIEKLRE